MNRFKLLTLLACLPIYVCIAQPSFTANTTVPTFTGQFRAGSNFSDYYSGFSDEQLSDLAAGAGAKAVRPTLPESFVQQWGYNVRSAAFNHYQSVNGMSDNTVIIGFPSDAHRNTTTITCNTQTGPVTVQSETFANLYEPIWVNGAVNPNNYYAIYVWNLVQTYGSHVKFWEVWNEPGLDYSGYLGYQNVGTPGNWWENNPSPCDYKLRAPIFEWIRILRISYEVIKTANPNAFVLSSSVGYQSFLDATLRNTDNPVNGSVTPQYPNKGGAYFDGIAHHAYPHFDNSVRTWNSTTNMWDNQRNSDGASEGMWRVIQSFQPVYNTYGYDGVTYPKKKWLISECNVPRQAFSYGFGSGIAQRNFIPKAYIQAAKNGIMQWHIWQIGERTPPLGTANYEFDRMGLYERINSSATPVLTEEGIALKTTSSILYGKTYDAARTAALNLPSNVGGAAFNDGAGFVYVLWAKTTTDQSETASATYSFPSGLLHSSVSLIQKDWNFGVNNTTSMVSDQNIALTGSPIFLSPATVLPIELTQFSGKSERDANVLSWQTASEKDVNYFEVERSSDGTHFKSIGSVKAIGQSTTPQYYSLRDAAPPVGLQYYRLRMVEENKVSYSKIVAITSSLRLGVEVSPNPFDKSLQLEIAALANAENLDISVQNIAGQILIQQKITTSGNQSLLTLTTENLPQGMYTVTVKSATDFVQKKVVK